VLVVDSGSTDNTIQIAKDFEVEYQSYRFIGEFNYSRSLNQGFSCLETDYVFIISSHTILSDPMIASYMIHPLEEDENVIASYVVPSDEREPSLDVVSSRISRLNFNGWNGLWNTCALIRRSRWLDRNFSEFLWAAEDQEWAAWWFSANPELTVVRYEGLSVANRNPKMLFAWKLCSDYVSIATYSLPSHYSLRQCLGKVLLCVKLRARCGVKLRGNLHFLREICLLLYRAKLLKFTSCYHDGPPPWIKWLFVNA
jgi:glycosyltransferase involved in cell wall biosynthesis